VAHLKDLKGPTLFSPFSIESSMAERITQIQTTITRQEGQATILDCVFKTRWTIYTVLWYKQTLSGGMDFLIYHEYSKPNAKQDHCSATLKEQKNLPNSSSLPYNWQTWQITSVFSGIPQKQK
jgi:hypothetical protein